jgi:hypothetical protein
MLGMLGFAFSFDSPQDVCTYVSQSLKNVFLVISYGW